MFPYKRDTPRQCFETEEAKHQRFTSLYNPRTGINEATMFYLDLPREGGEMDNRCHLIDDIYNTWRDSHRTPEAIAVRQWARLANLIRFARANSKYYRKLYDDLPENISNVKRLPVVGKPELMANFDDWVTDPAVTRERIDAFVADKGQLGEPFLGKYLVWTTSGSTGKPGIFVHDHNAAIVYGAIVRLRVLSTLNASILARSTAALLSHKYWAVAVVATDGHFGALVLAEMIRKRAPLLRERLKILSVLSPLPELVDKLNRFKPVFISGYPTALLLLAQEQIAGRLQIAPVFIATIGEWLSPVDREYIATAFRCEVRDYYGTSEFPPVALGCREGWLHTNPDWEILEPVDRNFQPVPPGVPSYTVLLTNLANRIQPIIRYDLGDSITVNPDPCACGCSLPSVRVEGRQSDILFFTTSDGRVVRVLPLALSTVVEEAPAVKSFQLIQREPLAVSLRLEPEPGAAGQETWVTVAERLQVYLSNQGLSSVRIVRDPELPHRDPVSGKFRQIWSEVKAT